MALYIGLTLGLGTCLFATAVGFDRDRSYYPVVMVVIAFIYVLFAAMGGTTRTLLIESSVAVVFAAVSVLGFKKHLWLAAAALVAHGLFDGVHGQLIANAGVPEWWPAFCASFDVAAGAYMAGLLWYRREGRARRPALTAVRA